MDDKYIEFLENMVILLAGSYQKTHDVLLAKMKEGNKAYLDMPTVQGISMSIAVDRISELKTEGKISFQDLHEYVDCICKKYK